MKNDSDTKDYIYELCLRQNIIEYSQFKDKIYKACDESEDCNNYPDDSTIRRWFNKDKVPSKLYMPIVAKALNVTVEELICGRDSQIKKELDKMTELYKANEYERQAMLKVLYFEKDYLSFISYIMILIGVVLLDYTYLHIWFVSIFAIGVGIYLTKNNFKKYQIDITNNNKPDLSTIETIKKFITLYKSGNIVMRIGLLYLIILTVVSLLPLIEFILYRGKYYISCFLYLILGIMLYLVSIKKK